MDAGLQQKKERLQALIEGMGSVAVAFSAGVDSTYLLKVSHDILGDRAVAVTARSPAVPQRELEAAKAFCRAEGITHVIVTPGELDTEGFRKNPPERCYICKRKILTELISAANALGISNVIEGANTDDDGDYRPGKAAVAELGVKSPLREAGLTKAEIRALSKELGLPTWDKPSFACLYTRFAYGETITEEKLVMVERAEQKLLDLGFERVRVRVHGDIARIEIDPAGFERIVKPETASEINAYLRKLGFMYVSLDLGGYTTGSMNRALEL